MSESEDKAKKLKEIQDRLAEIQGGTAKSPSKPLVSKEKKADIKKEDAPIPPKKAKAETNDIKSESAKVSSTTKPLSKKEAVDDKALVDKEVKKSPKPSRTKSQEEVNWKENRTRNPKGESKSRSGSKLSKIYTIISMIVTLAVCSYFIYSIFFSSSNDDIITSKVPEEIKEEASINEDNSDEPLVTEAISMEETEEAAVSQSSQNTASENMVAENTPTTVKENTSPVSEKANRSKTESAVVTKVPNGVIISYASNSTKEMASKNANMLKGKGFKASFYFMPDKNSTSPQLYKVYVGPYDNESAAMPDFKKIVQLNDKAFILRAN